MRRLIAIVLVIAALTPLLWVREPVLGHKGPPRLHFTQISEGSLDPGSLGPFRLEKAWTIEDRSGRYGSYSGLVALGDSRLLAVSDGGLSLEFSAPGASHREASVGGTVVYPKADKYHQDAECATLDPVTGTVWLSFEFSNTVARCRQARGRS